MNLDNGLIKHWAKLFESEEFKNGCGAEVDESNPPQENKEVNEDALDTP